MLSLYKKFFFYLILSHFVSAWAFAASTTVPLMCFKTAVEKSFPWVGVKTKSKLFVSCKNEKSAPVRGQYRPKYTAEQVAELQKSFINIADCLDVDARFVFPIFYNESGMHYNIQNVNGDTGIGQLTRPAITDVDNALDDIKSHVFSSSKKSCQWLASSSKLRKDFWKPVEEKSRCALMAKPWNPLRNILYAMAYIKLNEKYIDKSYERKEMRELLYQLGINHKDEEHIKRLLLILSYNTGGSVAVRNLEDYLKRRVNENIFKFNGYILPTLPSIIAREKKSASQLSHYDFDFSGYNKVDDLRKKYSKFMDNEEIQEALLNIPVTELTFPEYLAIYQSHGTDGYVSKVFNAAKEFQKQIGMVSCFDTTDFHIQ